MTRTIARISDRLLAALVPGTVAAAGDICDPYDYYAFCLCYQGTKVYRKCHVYSNCSTQCSPCDISFREPC